MNIKDKIHTIRGLQVILDRDLAELYHVDLKRLNEQVKRNINRFPKRFMFQLTASEYDSLRSQIATLEKFEKNGSNLKSQIATSKTKESLRFQNGTLDKNDILRCQNGTSKTRDPLRSQIVTSKKGRGMHRKYLPYVFTEQGVSMLSGVLKSDIAVKVSIQIMDAFVAMRKFISSNAQMFQRLDRVELKQIEYDNKFEQVFNAIEDKGIKPSKGIFYDGQIFDAYKFVSNLIKDAKSIVLIDNYVDDSVLTLFSIKKIDVVIYTRNITKKLELDVKKFNSQYGNVVLKEFTKSHDRFMIIDNKEVYHFGASLKDLGKKWFAFSKFDKEALKLLEELK